MLVGEPGDPENICKDRTGQHGRDGRKDNVQAGIDERSQPSVADNMRPRVDPAPKSEACNPVTVIRISHPLILPPRAGYTVGLASIHNERTIDYAINGPRAATADASHQ